MMYKFTITFLIIYGSLFLGHSQNFGIETTANLTSPLVANEDVDLTSTSSSSKAGFGIALVGNQIKFDRLYINAVVGFSYHSHYSNIYQGGKVGSESFIGNINQLNFSIYFSPIYIPLKKERRLEWGINYRYLVQSYSDGKYTYYSFGKFTTRQMQKSDLQDHIFHLKMKYVDRSYQISKFQIQPTASLSISLLREFKVFPYYGTANIEAGIRLFKK